MKINSRLIILGACCICISTLFGQNIIKNKNLVFPIYKILTIYERPKFYIIYATRNDSTFKILTEKIYNNIKHSKIRIKLNKEYPLDLQSLFLKEWNGIKFVPLGTDLRNAVNFCDESVPLEPLKNTLDIFIAKNLVGLYLDESTILETNHAEEDEVVTFFDNLQKDLLPNHFQQYYKGLTDKGIKYKKQINDSVRKERKTYIYTKRAENGYLQINTDIMHFLESNKINTENLKVAFFLNGQLIWSESEILRLIKLKKKPLKKVDYSFAGDNNDLLEIKIKNKK